MILQALCAPPLMSVKLLKKPIFHMKACGRVKLHVKPVCRMEVCLGLARIIMEVTLHPVQWALKHLVLHQFKPEQLALHLQQVIKILYQRHIHIHKHLQIVVETGTSSKILTEFTGISDLGIEDIHINDSINSGDFLHNVIHEMNPVIKCL